MQMVIEIPKWFKEMIDKGETPQDFPLWLAYGIHKGIVLPKGHGRIADMDAAIKCIEDVEGEDANWAICLIEWACGKRTIIEEDRGEEE